MSMQTENFRNWKSLARSQDQTENAEKILGIADYKIAQEALDLAVKGDVKGFRSFVEKLEKESNRPNIKIKILVWLKELQEKYSQQLKDPQNEEEKKENLPNLNNINVCIEIVEGKRQLFV